MGVVVALLLAAAAAKDLVPNLYELDVARPGEARIAPLSDEDLAKALHDAGFDLVLWLAPDDPRASSFPLEPTARGVDPTAAGDATIAALTAPFAAEGVHVAVGRRRVADWSAIPPIPADDTVLLQASDGSPDGGGVRVVRPAVRNFLWCDPAGPIQNLNGSLGSIAVSSRLLTPTAPALKATQMRLDLMAFSNGAVWDPPKLDAALAIQSRIASHLAIALGGSAPQACLPFENEWIGGAPLVATPPLRRGAPLLDLEEWLWSDGRPSWVRPHLDFVLESSDDVTTPGCWLPDDVFVCDTPPATPLPAGRLSVDECHALAALVEARLKATCAFGRFLARGEPRQLDAVKSALAEQEAIVAKLTQLHDAWAATLAADRALVESTAPWRVHYTTWTLRSKELDAPKTVKLARVDDARLGGWSRHVEELLGGRDLDLWKYTPVHAGLDVTLSTDFALRDPRSIRLRVDAAATRTVRLNGAPLVEAFDAGRGPLLTTIALPAGKSTLEIALTLDGTSGDVALDAALLPHRVEGVFLDPASASRVSEPVVKLKDPTALGEECLVWPRGRRRRKEDASEKECEAAFPFAVGEPARDDAWIHALPRGESDARLALRCDDGAAQTVTLRRGSGWRWVRADAPLEVAHGDHALVVRWLDEEVRVDQVVLLDGSLTIPATPRGDAPLTQSFWRFDPLGVGIVADLPRSDAGPLIETSFSVERSGSYEVLAWLKGADPLVAGQTAELELVATTNRTRFVLPAGTPLEEWVSLGTVNLVAGERNRLEARGAGALARAAFVR